MIVRLVAACLGPGFQPAPLYPGRSPDAEALVPPMAGTVSGLVSLA